MSPTENPKPKTQNIEIDVSEEFGARGDGPLQDHMADHMAKSCDNKMTERVRFLGTTSPLGW